MIVLGKNSTTYNLIKRELPFHLSFSHKDIEKQNFQNERILILSFPPSRKEAQRYLNLIEFLSKDNIIIYVSTSGLNGIPLRLQKRYHYLSLKREAEKLVLRNNGIVLRCGRIVDKFDQNLSGFQTTVNKLCEAFLNISNSSLYYIGQFNEITGRKLFVKIFDHLILKLSILPLLFQLIHAAMMYTRNRGYTRYSDIMFQKDLSIGKGLSALSDLKNLMENIAPPFSLQQENRKDFLNFSLKENGFGEKWHGVSPNNVKHYQNCCDQDLYIPLIPRGRLLFLFGNLFGHTHRLLVKQIVSSDHFVVVNGIGEDGHEEALAIRSCVLNAGILENLKIIAKSLETDISVKFGNHELASIYPISIKKAWKKSKFTKWGHTKLAIVSKFKGNNYLAIPRPVLPFKYENAIIFSSTLSKIRFFVSNLRWDLIVWVLYSKLGIRLFSFDQCQLDIQHKVSQDYNIMQNGEYRESSKKNTLRRDELKELASHIDGISLQYDTNVLRSGMNGLHLHIERADIDLKLVTKPLAGGWYLGSSGNLFDYSAAMHSSYRLLENKVYLVSKKT